MIGIYKITNPKGRIYIGQSVNIERRWTDYNNIKHRTQPKLKNSIEKYGIENHIFEIIEECLEEQLNIRERYWQDYFNVLEKGLNCRLTQTEDKSGKDSQYTIQRKSDSLKKKILQYDKQGNFIREWNSIKEAQNELNISRISKVCSYKLLSSGGFIWRFINDPLPLNFRYIEKRGNHNSPSEETRKKMSISGKGVPQPEHFSKLISKPVIQYDLEDNFIKEWSSIKEASSYLNIDIAAISKCCRNIYRKTHNYKFKYKIDDQKSI